MSHFVNLILLHYDTQPPAKCIQALLQLTYCDFIIHSHRSCMMEDMYNLNAALLHIKQCTYWNKYNKTTYIVATMINYHLFILCAVLNRIFINSKAPSIVWNATIWHVRLLTTIIEINKEITLKHEWTSSIFTIYEVAHVHFINIIQ